MEMNQSLSKKKLITMIIILSVLLIGLIGYVVYDNFFADKGIIEEKTNNDINNNNEDNQVKTNSLIGTVGDMLTSINSCDSITCLSNGTSLAINNGTLLFKLSNGIEKNVSNNINEKIVNILKAGSCSGNTQIFLITESGNLYYNKYQSLDTSEYSMNNLLYDGSYTEDSYGNKLGSGIYFEKYNTTKKVIGLKSKVDDNASCAFATPMVIFEDNSEETIQTRCFQGGNIVSNIFIDSESHDEIDYSCIQK